MNTFRDKKEYCCILLLYGICFIWIGSGCSDRGGTVKAPLVVVHEIDSLKRLCIEAPIDTALILQRKINTLAQKYRLTKELVASYCQLGFLVGRTQMNFAGGKRLIDSAANLVQQTGRQDLWPLVNLQYSVLYKYDDSSLYYIEKVIPRLNELDTISQILAFCTIANIHSGRGNGKIAREYYAKALELIIRLNPREPNREAGLYSNIANTYIAQGDTVPAQEYWRRALQLITPDVEKTGEIEYIYGNAGQCFIDRGMPDSALPLIRKYAEIVYSHYTGPQRLLPNIYFAQIALQKKQYKRVDTLLRDFGYFIDTADISSPLMPGFSFVRIYYESLFAMKKATGDFSGALKVLEKQKRFSSLTNQRTTDETVMQYEKNMEKTKADMALAQKEKKYANDRLLFYSAIFLLITLLSIAVTLIVFFRNKKRMEERKLAELHQASIIEKKDLLLKAETTERKRIAQEFHDELGGALTVIGMTAQALRRLNIDAVKQPVEILQRNSEKLTTQVNEIVWSLNDQNDTLGSLLAYMQRYLEQFLQDAGLRYAASIQTDKKELPVDGYKRRYIFQSVKECLHNSVKHSGATELRCEIATTATELRIVVADNGKGMPDAERLIRGNGIDNIRKNIQALGGGVRWSVQEGTVVTINIPLQTLGKEAAV